MGHAPYCRGSMAHLHCFRPASPSACPVRACFLQGRSSRSRQYRHGVTGPTSSRAFATAPAKTQLPVLPARAGPAQRWRLHARASGGSTRAMETPHARLHVRRRLHARPHVQWSSTRTPLAAPHVRWRLRSRTHTCDGGSTRAPLEVPHVRWRLHTCDRDSTRAPTHGMEAPRARLWRLHPCDGGSTRAPTCAMELHTHASGGSTRASLTPGLRQPTLKCAPLPPWPVHTPATQRLPRPAIPSSPQRGQRPWPAQPWVPPTHNTRSATRTFGRAPLGLRQLWAPPQGPHAPQEHHSPPAHPPELVLRPTIQRVGWTHLCKHGMPPSGSRLGSARLPAHPPRGPQNVPTSSSSSSSSMGRISANVGRSSGLTLRHLKMNFLSAVGQLVASCSVLRLVTCVHCTRGAGGGMRGRRKGESAAAPPRQAGDLCARGAVAPCEGV